jgi:acyl-CoA thioester hydrolase
MVSSDIQIRVRYAETDRMGYVYYGNYSVYFEVGRVEALRKLGFSYRQMEDEGVMLPVLEYSVKYFKPAYYDDLLTIRTIIPEIPSGARIRFMYETLNEKCELLNKAETTLVFVNKATGKPGAAPDWFIKAMQSFYKE